MLHDVQISERKVKYRYYKCENTAQCPANPKWLWWQITLRVADNMCGLSVSYRKKIANVIGWDCSTHIQVQRA
jgi:hypothetical protein